MPRVLQPEKAARLLQGEERRGGGLQSAGLSGQTVGRGGHGEPAGGPQTEGDSRTAWQECRSGMFIHILNGGPIGNNILRFCLNINTL